MQQNVYNPFSGEDEVIVKDKDGKLKVLKDGVLHDLGGKNSDESDEEMQKNEDDALLKDDLAKSFLPMPGGVEPASDSRNSAAAKLSAPLSYTEIAEKIVPKLGVNLDDEILKKRFKNIVLSRIKEVRNRIETQEALKRSQKVGGLGLSENEASDLDKKLEGMIAKMKEDPTLFKELEDELVLDSQEKKMYVAKPDEIAPLPPHYQEQRNTEEEMAKKEEAEIAVKNRDNQAEKVSERKKKLLEQRDRMRALKIKQEVEKINIDIVKPLAKAEDSIPKNDEKNPAKDLKEVKISEPDAEQKEKKMEEAKPETKLVGPVEEMRVMTIDDFRRLDKDPEKAIKKIMDKVDLLEKESFPMRYQGVSAWRQSEIFRVYTEIGRESMETKKSIGDVIEEMKKAGKPYLEEAEFMAIMDLNRQLRY